MDWYEPQNHEHDHWVVGEHPVQPCLAVRGSGRPAEGDWTLAGCYSGTLEKRALWPRIPNVKARAPTILTKWPPWLAEFEQEVQDDDALSCAELRASRDSDAHSFAQSQMMQRNFWRTIETHRNYG
jgi:hypothetical protein